MSTFNKSQPTDSFPESQKQIVRPIFETVEPATGKEREAYRQQLRQFFRSGKRTAAHPTDNIIPATFYPYLQDQNTVGAFPALYDHETRGITSLERALQTAIQEVFDTANTDMPFQMPPVSTFFVQQEDGNGPVLDYPFQAKAVVEAIRQFGEQAEDAQAFGNKCDQLEKKLLTRKATLIDFASNTAFQLLKLQLQQRQLRNLEFLKKLQAAITGVTGILQLHGGKPASTQSQFSFASDLVAFDKITDLTSRKDQPVLSEAKRQRLHTCLQTLTEAHTSYTANCITVFTTQQLADEFELQQALPGVTLTIAPEAPCATAKATFDQDIKAFTETITALRLAELAISYTYQDELHGPYFEGFDRSYLSDDDIRYFRSLLVVTGSQELTQQTQDFLRTLSAGDFLKVLVINHLEDLFGTNTVEDSNENFLELTALAIFRRNAYVFQGGMDTPDQVNEAIQKGLNATSPVLWNILCPTPEAREIQNELSTIKAAIESRFFPRITYDIQSGDDFGSHFDISANPQSVQHYPTVELAIEAPSGVQLQKHTRTAADFLAIHPSLSQQLEVVPPQFQDDNLLPLAEYLTIPQEQTAGKIPFIWVVDEAQRMQQAAVPATWLRRIRDRLDYWTFIQELGGVRSAHLANNLAVAETEWKATQETALANQKTELQAEFEQARTQDLEQSIKNILNALLASDVPIESFLNQASTTKVPMPKETVEEAPPQQAEKKEEPVTEAANVPVSNEVWVETDECTSCSDCINLVPAVFKYDGNKQAIVHNPKGGSYAKIVAAAEKCPARCIHPGLPHDKKEKGIEKLLKRAEKYQ